MEPKLETNFSTATEADLSEVGQLVGNSVNLLKAAGGCGCGGDSSQSEQRTEKLPPQFIYSLGSVVPRFPSLSVEKEFSQAVSRQETANLIAQQVNKQVLADPKNRYLAKKLCWTFQIQGIDSYILVPRDPSDISLLIDSVRDVNDRHDIDLVIGVRGPLSSPEQCAGSVLPIVFFDQIYSFDKKQLVESIAAPKDADKKQFAIVADNLFARVMQLADNAGASDEHRALNYLAIRYKEIYMTVAEKYSESKDLTAVDTIPSRLSSSRKIVDVIFTFAPRTGAANEKQFVRVDVTEEFPFLVSPIQTFYDR